MYPALALLDAVLRLLIQAEVHKAQCQIAGVVLNGADVVEDLFQALVQEPLIRVLLDLDEVRHSGSTRYTVSVEDTDNGSVKVSPTRASKGSTVTVTVKPDEGYELDELTVTDKNGDSVRIIKSNGKYTFKMPASKVTVEAVFTAVEPEPEGLPFTSCPK